MNKLSQFFRCEPRIFGCHQTRMKRFIVSGPRNLMLFSILLPNVLLSLVFISFFYFYFLWLSTIKCSNDRNIQNDEFSFLFLCYCVPLTCLIVRTFYLFCKQTNRKMTTYDYQRQKNWQIIQIAHQSGKIYTTISRRQHEKMEQKKKLEKLCAFRFYFYFISIHILCGMIFQFFCFWINNCV